MFEISDFPHSIFSYDSVRWFGIRYMICFQQGHFKIWFLTIEGKFSAVTGFRNQGLRRDSTRFYEFVSGFAAGLQATLLLAQRRLISLPTRTEGGRTALDHHRFTGTGQTRKKPRLDRSVHNNAYYGYGQIDQLSIITSWDTRLHAVIFRFHETFTIQHLYWC